MEDLFSTSLTVHHHHGNYKVTFDHEKYIFTSEANSDDLPSFSLKREHDEWHEQETIPRELKDRAVNALEKYLLKQH